MENQAQFRNIEPESVEKHIPEKMTYPWWEIVGEQLDLGVFFVSSRDKRIYINPVLQRWLGMEEAFLEEDHALWERISSMAADPSLVIGEFHLIRENREDHRRLLIPLKTGEGTLSIHLYSLEDANGMDRGYGGFVSKDLGSNQKVKDRVKVFDNILVPARQITASIQGNLGALSGNFQNWSPEVVDQFLEIARGDINRMRQFLDLGLSYSKIVSQTSLLNQSVSVVEFLERIIQEEDLAPIKIHQLPPELNEPLQVKIDQALVKIALQTLLREIVDRTSPGQQLELQISEKDGFVLLSLDSPRMLPLPGLAAEKPVKETSELSPDLFLAKEILVAQGGNLIFERRLADEGGGLDIQVSLPKSQPVQHPPIRHEWRAYAEKNTERILLAETQPEYQLLIRDALTQLGYRVDLAVDGNTVLDLIQTRQPNLVILARNMPNMDGLLITQGVRRWSEVPIIMISMRDSADDLLNAYRLGVDDYLGKPFLIEELLAKIQVFLSRQAAALRSITPEIYQEGSIRIDHGTREVWVRGNLVQLTPIEYNLLVYLSRQGRQIIPYEQLLEHVWEGPEQGTRQGLFVHVRRLREKIEENPKSPQIITNKWGVGYEFNP